MPNAIAFFPWVTLREPVAAGPLRLIPYNRGRTPSDLPHVTLADVDGVLSAYALRKNKRVQRATLVELGSWNLGLEADDATQAALFRARELTAFAALAKRRLFRSHLSGYCNFDTYAFVLQNFQAGSTGAFSFSTRHRDSSANHLWSSDEFAFVKPLHVAMESSIDIDPEFLRALFLADAAGKLPFEAIVEFNRANTDSNDVPLHVEVVLVKSAFEFLFGISERANEFVASLRSIVPERPAGSTPTGPLSERWKEARPKTTRPLEAWAREFCDLRGGAAHGKSRNSSRFVWSEHAHLAFGAIMFPLLIKHRLADDGYFSMSERDSIELAWIEAYLMHHPFATRDHFDATEHPWSAIYTNHIVGEILRRRLQERLDVIGRHPT